MECPGLRNGKCGFKDQLQTSRANEVSKLLCAVQDLLIPFISAADNGRPAIRLANGPSNGHRDIESLESALTSQWKPPSSPCIGCVDSTCNGNSTPSSDPPTGLVEYHRPSEFTHLMNLKLPEAGLGQAGFVEQVQKILKYSVNTWHPGFMSKLYGSTDAPGVAAELILATLNTQVHTFQVSPALTMIEKYTARALANLFGLTGPHAGGITVQGGSASNTTSVVIARNTLFPDTKNKGNAANGLKLLMFTSAHGHYSVEKAALMLGLGSSSVWSVPVDPVYGSMDPSALSSLIIKARNEGYTPFYLNATAGTTVLGSFDPIIPLAEICREQSIWLHIDASWGGPLIFSPSHKHKLKGSHLANSIAINPHKMMGVPVTCSFLLGPDLCQFHASNTLPASYLFHSVEPSSDVYDLADLTLQCGRKGDSLKVYLSWTYHGTEGYVKQINDALDTTAHLAMLVSKHDDLVLVSQNPPPCCQVCFFYAKSGILHENGDENSRITKQVVQGLVAKGFMIDYACIDKRGCFMRPVVSRGTGRQTVEALIDAVLDLGSKIEKIGKKSDRGDGFCEE